MKSSKTSSVHVFQMPLPVWTAIHFSTMIDWASEQICEPPFLRNHTIEDIKAFEITPLTLDVPSNTQHVERYIQLATQNGTRAATPTLRQGLCHATIRSRTKRPKLESKIHFSN